MNWRKYESHIFEHLRAQFPNADIRADQQLFGRYSSTNRQIDILVEGRLLGYDVRAIVDCKHFSRKVDVKVVDEFVGFMSDIGAHIGMLITNGGYSPAAQRRAANDPQTIHLEIVEPSKMSDREFDPLALVVPIALASLSDKHDADGPLNGPSNFPWQYFDIATPRLKAWIENLNNGSLKVLFALADNPLGFSEATVAESLNMPVEGVRRHISLLIRDGYVRSTPERYVVFEPLAIWWLMRRSRPNEFDWNKAEWYLTSLATSRGYKTASYAKQFLPTLSLSNRLLESTDAQPTVAGDAPPIGGAPLN